jgi:ADP-heptose:LPS heptosyltransferase
VKPSSIGDIVHALQVAATLKNKRPEIAIDWVVRDIFSPVVACSSLVENIIAFKRAGLGDLFRCCREIGRSGTYDAVWDMQGLLRSAIMTRCAKGLRRIGRYDGREFSTLFYGECTAKAGNPHAVEILSQFLPTLSVEAKATRPIKFTVAEPLPIDLPANGRSIILAPESRGKNKEWPHYKELTAKLCGRFPDWRFIWVGLGKNGQSAPVGFANFFDLRGKTSLPQLLSLIEHCSGTIANDSACMHMAAAMTKPVLGIFLRTDPLRCGPYPLDDRRHFIAKNPPVEFDALENFIHHIVHN